MANMFSGNQQKKIPKNFKDCYKTDGITQNLWLWCERLEKWGFRICIVLAVIGIISIISNGIETAQLLDELNIDMNEIKTASAEYGIEIKSVFAVVVEDILKWSFYCFLEYCLYHILALLTGSLASIVQHTKITANIALYNFAKTEEITEDTDIRIENDDTYKQTSCTIKKKKQSAQKKEKYKNQFEYEDETPPIIPDGYWRCMGCGEILPDDRNECNCGYKR